ncbi:MAG: hypothetical protein FWC56_00970, partial [Phycisphaerae bacterium]|nr:hypothetical protein [Phycisphaerae bacterium]
ATLGSQKTLRKSTAWLLRPQELTAGLSLTPVPQRSLDFLTLRQPLLNETSPLEHSRTLPKRPPV